MDSGCSLRAKLRALREGSAATTRAQMQPPASLAAFSANSFTRSQFSQGPVGRPYTGSHRILVDH